MARANLRTRHTLRTVFIIFLMAAYLGLSGCGSWCRDADSREGAWGLWFRCHYGGSTRDDSGSSSGKVEAPGTESD